MTRRGPDATAYFESRECTLLHARLVVIDPAGGAQPMCWQRGNESYTIVYNGELYNTPELREELKNLGHCFLSHSDTEVLLHAYAQWKEKCVDKLNGIFAFAIWEHHTKRLFLARDRMGVKPLFYKLHEGGLLFASEIKTILAYPTVKAQLDIQGASEILLLGPGRTPGCGVFRGIFELEPGCCGYYSEGELTLRRYWKLLDREHTDTFEQTAEKVRELVMDAIKRQMVSDVPIGTFLSGGLDSSLITAVCANEIKAKGKRLKTFSVDYVDNDKYFVPKHDGNNIYTYEKAYSFAHGLAAVKKEGKWGFVNKKFEEVIPCQYDSCRYYFEGELARVYTKAENYTIESYINKQNQTVWQMIRKNN